MNMPMNLFLFLITTLSCDGFIQAGEWALAGVSAAAALVLGLQIIKRSKS